MRKIVYSVSLDPEVVIKARQLAKKQNLSFSELVNRLLKGYVREVLRDGRGKEIRAEKK